MTLVSIGGGEIKEEETLEIDKKIVEITGEKEPRALFVPTASNDAEGYIKTFNQIYGNKLNCKTDTLKLVEEEPSDDKIKEKIQKADIIYVGGGNTDKMLKKWREKNLDKYLKEAEESGTILSGLSAGAICWFEKYHTDSEKFESETEWSYTISAGLNYIEDIITVPHYLREENRKEDIKEKIYEIDETIIAIDDNAAIKITDGRYSVLRSKKQSKVYKIQDVNGKIEEKKLEEGNLSELKQAK